MLWGYKHQLVSWQTFIAIANDRLMLGSLNPMEIDLSIITKEDTFRINKLVHVLANREEIDPEDNSEQKWLFILLSWLYENRSNIVDPLAKV